MLAGAMLQGILSPATRPASAFALDIESGFFDRLLAAPISRFGDPHGAPRGGVMLAMAQTLLFLAIGIVFGARVQGGLLGVFSCSLLAALLAVASSGLGVILRSHGIGRGRAGAVPPRSSP